MVKKNLLAIKVIPLQVRILPKFNYFTEKLAASIVINLIIKILICYYFHLMFQLNCKIIFFL